MTQIDLQKAQGFLSASGWKDTSIDPLNQDASARKYYRLSQGGKTAILMHAPPPFEETGAFAEKAEIFRHYGWSVPAIHARDAKQGLLLLEDFGNTSFADAIAKGQSAAELYNTATKTLIHLHKQSDKMARKLPPLDDARLTYLTSWLIEWYIPFIQPQALSRVIREKFIDLWVDAFKIMRAAPLHAAHLDYQFHNLMRLDRPGIAACGVLDFQDACFAPVTCDLVLLLQNARENVDPAIVDASLKDYLAAFPEIDPKAFYASYAVAAAQNAARILGLFARLKIRDGKAQYLKHIPRNLKYLEQSLEHPALAPIRDWFDEHAPKHLRLNIPGLQAA